MQNAIIYQAYGGQDFINECRYSVLKYLQVYNLTPPAGTAIVVYTDTPAAFADFQPFLKQLDVRTLAKEEVKKWRGAIDFVHRVKIEMLLDYLQTFSGNVLYCDTDTYLTTPVEPLFEDLQQGRFYLHEYEGVIDKTINPSFHKWQKFLSSTPVRYNNKDLVFSTSLQMFNAGVVGLNSDKKEVLQDVLALTDAVYRQFPKHIAEQFAFSYCFQKIGSVSSADDAIAHYWNLKEFRQLLQTFFRVNGEESIPNLIKKLNAFDAMDIQAQKNAFRRLPLLKKLYRNIAGKGWKIGQYEKRLSP